MAGFVIQKNKKNILPRSMALTNVCKNNLDNVGQHILVSDV